MRFDPVPENELVNLIAPGEYDAEVAEAESFTSKNGNDGIKLKVRVFLADSQRVIFDYLMSTPDSMFKVHNFCAAAGILEKYESGELRPVDCQDRAVMVKVGIEKGKDGYADKNKISSYVVAKKEPAPSKMPTNKNRYQPVSAPDGSVDDDGVPF